MEATYKVSANDKPVIVQDKGMRLLKRQSDGSMVPGNSRWLA
jgi:hypothetical protein